MQNVVAIALAQTLAGQVKELLQRPAQKVRAVEFETVFKVAGALDLDRSIFVEETPLDEWQISMIFKGAEVSAEIRGRLLELLGKTLEQKLALGE